MSKCAEEKGAATTRMVGVACMTFFCNRSCHSRSFLIAAFCFASQSLRRVCKNTIVINISCGLYQKSVISVRRSMSSVSQVGCSFLGAPGAFVSVLPSPPSPPRWPTLVEGFMTRIGGSCLACPAPASAVFGGGYLRGRDCCC